VILDRLQKRRTVDSLESQIARARAAVAMRRTDLIRTGTAIRNAEAQVRALVNSPAMLADRQMELVPVEPPSRQLVPIHLSEAVPTALENRPEIDAAAQEIEAARVRLNVARNELMPVLDMVLETYVTGLRGDYRIGRSFADQFSVGEPSYTAGLAFELPIHRRTARAPLQQRQVELRQLSAGLQATMENMHAEVEVAVRKVETVYRELHGVYESMVAVDVDVQYLQHRWESLPGDDRAASFLLEDLLDSQNRLALEESRFAGSQADYAVSLTRVNRATGTLLKYENIQLVRACEGCLPANVLEKAGFHHGPVPAPAGDTQGSASAAGEGEAEQPNPQHASEGHAARR
jgi:outer membrane protein TolC